MKHKSSISPVPARVNRDNTEALQDPHDGGDPCSAAATDLRPRAIQRLWCSPEYLQALRDCEAVHAAKQKSTDVKLVGEIPPRLIALFVFLAIAVSTIIWAGCRVVNSLPAAVALHREAIVEALDK